MKKELFSILISFPAFRLSDEKEKIQEVVASGKTERDHKRHWGEGQGKSCGSHL